MGVELIDLDIGGETHEAVVNAQAADPDVGVVVVPGAGHGPFGDIFDVIAWELAGAGAQVLRYETWESREELEAKTLGELHEELEAGVDYLRSDGCETVRVLAKSFGGGVALSHVPDAVDRMVLWAPAVEFGVDPGDATTADDRIGDGEGLLIGIDDLDHVDVPVDILVGTEDRGVSVEHCERLVEAAGDGDVTAVPGENHSFNQNRTTTVDRTLASLVPDR